jgi:hypothetical protein
MLNSLLNPPPPVLVVNHSVLKSSGYATAAFVALSIRIPNPNVYLVSQRPKPPVLPNLSTLGDWLHSAFDWFLGFFTMNARATVTFDAQNSATRTDTSDPYVALSYTPVGTPRAIIVVVIDDGTEASQVAGVYYGGSGSGSTCTGGVLMASIIRGADGTTEQGNAEIFFLGSSIPTGTQTVCVDLTSGTGDDMLVGVIGYTAAGDTRIIDADALNNNQADPSVTEAYGGLSAISVMGFFSGLTSPSASACSGNGVCSNVGNVDFGQQAGSIDKGPAAGTTDQVMGYTAATDDLGFAVISFTDAACASGRFWVGGTGSWSQTTHWSDATGGFSGCAAPTSSNAVTFDAASATAAATITVDTSASMASFTDSGFNDASSTINLGANSWTNAGAETHSTSNLPFSCSTNGGSISISGALTLSGGNIACATSTTTAAVAAVNISAAASYIDFGSGAWTVSGTWTNATTTASWDAGTNTVTFTSATGGTMTFAGANLAEAEFNNVTFTSSAGTAQTFTMATRQLDWAGTLSITDSSGTTALATANLGLTGGAVSVGNAGILTANTSTVSASDVTMTGGTSGTITLSSTASWSVSGSWNTSGAGSTFTAATSTVTMTGASKTVAILNFSNGFWILTVTGTVTMNSAITTGNNVNVTSGSLSLNSNNLTFGAVLTVNGGSLIGAATATGWTVTNGASGTFTLTTITTWTADTHFVWAHTATGANNLTIDITVTVADTYTWVALKNGGAYKNGNVSSLHVTFTMVPSDPTMDVTVSAPSGCNGTGNCYWVSGATGGTISWTTGADWCTTSGGTTCGTLPATTDNVFFDTNSASVATTVTLAAATTVAHFTLSGTNMTVDATAGNSWALNITQWSLTNGTYLARGSTITCSGNFISSGGTFTRASSTVSLTGAGNLAVALNQELNLVSLAPSGFTTTMTGHVYVGNTVTFGGGILNMGSGFYYLYSSPTNGTNLVSGTGTITQSGNGTFWVNPPTGGTVTLNTSIAFWQLYMHFTGAAATNTVNFGSDIVANGGFWIDNGSSSASDIIVVNAQNHGLTTLSFNIIGTPGVAEYLSGTGTVVVNGDFISNGAATNYITSSAGGSWTVKGAWTNSSTSSSWSFAAPITFLNTAGKTMTFCSSCGGSNEFTGNVTFDSAATGSTSITYTMATNGLRWSATLTVQQTGASTGTTTLATTNLALTGGGITVAAKSVLAAANSTISVGDVTVSGASGYITSTGSGSWTDSGPWTNSSTSASWSFAAPMFFTSSTSQTLTFSAVTQEFANDLVFQPSSGTPVFTMGGSNGLKTGGNIYLRLGATLDTSASNLSLTVVGTAFFDNATGILVARASTVALGGLSIGGTVSYVTSLSGGSWTVSGAWTNSSTSASWSFAAPISFTSTASPNMTFANVTQEFGSSVSFLPAGTSTFTMAGSNALRWEGTLTIGNGTNTTALATANLGLTGGALTIPNAGTLTANASTVSVSNVTMTGGSSGTLTLTSGAWAVSGNWNTSGAGSTFTQGTSAITLSGASKTINLLTGQTFATLIVTGTVTLNTFLTASALTISAGSLSTNEKLITVNGDLTLSGGALIHTAIGGVTNNVITGNVNISSASSYMVLGDDNWRVDGSWTNASTSASWDAGTSYVTFDSTSNQNMTFAGSNLAVPEFNIVGFESTAGGAGTVTFSMVGAHGLVWGDHLHLHSSGSSTTELATGNLPLTGGELHLASSDKAGRLTAGSSTVSVTNVTMNTSGSYYITASGAWTVSGNWDTSGGHASSLVMTGSTVSMTGSGKAMATDVDDAFDNLTVSGSLTLNTSIVVNSVWTITSTGSVSDSNLNVAVTDFELESGGSMGIGTGDFNTVATWNVVGSLTMDGVTVSGMSISTGSGTVNITQWTSWVLSPLNAAWTMSASSSGITITMVISGVAPSTDFQLTRDGTTVDTETSTGGGVVTFVVVGGWGTNNMVASPAVSNCSVSPSLTYSSGAQVTFNPVGPWDDNHATAADGQGAGTPAILVTNNGPGSCDIGIKRSAASPAGVEDQWNTSNSPPTSGTNDITTSNQVVCAAVGNGATCAIYLWSRVSNPTTPDTYNLTYIIQEG